MNRDAVGQLRGLCQWLGQTMTPEFESGMVHWWRKNSEMAERSACCDAEAFGLSPDEFRPLFAEHISRTGRWTDKYATARAD